MREDVDKTLELGKPPVAPSVCNVRLSSGVTRASFAPFLVGLLALALVLPSRADSTKAERSGAAVELEDTMRQAERARAAVERQGAMCQLAETGAVDQVEVFLEALRHDDDWGVRYLAANALIKRGWKPDNLNDTILSAIYRSDWPGLMKIGPPAVQPLIDAYTQNHVHPWYGVGTWIPYAIAEIGDPRAIPLLTRTVLSGFPPRSAPRDSSVLTPTLSENSSLRDSVLGSFDKLIRMGHPAQEYLAGQLADTNRVNAYNLAEALLELRRISTNMAKMAFLSPLLPLLRDMDQQRQRVLIAEFTGDDETRKLRIPRDLDPLADERKLIPFAEFFKTSLRHTLIAEGYAVQESGTPSQDARIVSVSGTLKATVRVRRAGLRKIDVVTLGLARVFEDLSESKEFWGDCQVSVEATYQQGTKTVRKTYTSRTEHKVTAYRYGLLADATKNIVDNMARDLEAFASGSAKSLSGARPGALPNVKGGR